MKYLQVLDAPHDGQEDSRAAQQVHDGEDVLPRGMEHLALLALLDDDVRNVGQDLSKGMFRMPLK